MAREPDRLKFELTTVVTERDDEFGEKVEAKEDGEAKIQLPVRRGPPSGKCAPKSELEWGHVSNCYHEYKRHDFPPLDDCALRSQHHEGKGRDVDHTPIRVALHDLCRNIHGVILVEASFLEDEMAGAVANAVPLG